MLREGRVKRGPGEQPPLTEEMLLAALAWRIGVALEDEEPVAPLTPALTEFALAPYLGARGRAGARRRLSRAVGGRLARLSSLGWCLAPYAWAGWRRP